MLVSELMKDHAPSADYEGYITNNDWVLAVDISGKADTTPDKYAVVQMGVAGLDAQLNPVLIEKQYVRAGQSSIKTATQRTFKVTGDRYLGDAFQDYAFSHAVKFGTGSNVVVPYVYFNILNGKGEKGTATVVVNSDGGGAAGEGAAIDVDLKKNGVNPIEFTYTASAS